VSRIRDAVIGLIVLAAVFVIAQGAVGYFDIPRTSLLHWIVPAVAVLAVIVWYFRPTEDWTAGTRSDTRRDDRDGDPQP
jgi:4-amino-4-deoxy-L-arabinose transferase-like glycosyltransferase